jgi:hypothetical protein
MEYVEANRYDPLTRRRLVARFREHFDNGYRDPELLYLGGRYAVSLGMRREAQRFLEPLADMLCQDDRPSPSYAPVGLLLLSVLEEEHERDAVWARLRHLAQDDSLLNKEINALLGASPGQQQADGGAGSELVQLAEEARNHYEANDLEEARAALETLLLTDGDRPDVLRNLITVAGEQQDVEAYERYWRRYVRLLLWRLAQGDKASEAWQELTRFYTQVADATDRQLEGMPEGILKAIKRPGFLPRWLEAHAGLVWLESALKSRRTLQTALGHQHLEDGQDGNLGLMRYWFHLFYPEFSALLDLGSGDGEEPALPSAEAKRQLHFDPALRLLTRFLELQRLGFGLDARTIQDKESGTERQEIVQNRHAENIVALAGCIARIPSQHYTLELGEVLAKEQSQALEGQTLRRTLQDACSIPFFQLRLSSFLDDPPDWEGIDRFFGDPDMADRLIPTIHLFRALALCQLERPLEGLEVACKALPEIPPDELEEDTQNHGLWRNVVYANIGHALQAKKKPRVLPGMKVGAKDSVAKVWISRIEHEISSMPDEEHTDLIRVAALEWISEAYTQQVLLPEAVEKSKDLVAKHRFQEALRVIKELPDEPDELKEVKANLSGQIKEAESQYLLQHAIEDAIKTAKAAAEKGEFAAAVKVIKDLPDSPEEVGKLKKELLSQIREAEKHHRLQKRIDTALRRTKTYVKKGQFSQARKAINALPDSPAEVKEIKRNVLSQIDEAEEHHGLQARIDEGLSDAKRYAEEGDFMMARLALDGIPDSPAEVRKIKQDFLSQIDRVEKQAQEAQQIRAKIDKAIANSKRYVEKGDFNRARREVRALPDSPSEVRTLKRNLLSQIDDAEQAQKGYWDEIRALLDKFERRGVDMAAVGKIAMDNNIDITDQAQFYGLLKAIDEKLF